MRISDWSSDVCSSDLPLRVAPTQFGERADISHCIVHGLAFVRAEFLPALVPGVRLFRNADLDRRRSSKIGSGRNGSDMSPDERRVGQACVSTCMARWSPTD